MKMDVVAIHAVALDQGRDEFPIPLGVGLLGQSLEREREKDSGRTTLLHFLFPDTCLLVSTTRNPTFANSAELLLIPTELRNPARQY